MRVSEEEQSVFVQAGNGQTDGIGTSWKRTDTRDGYKQETDRQTGSVQAHAERSEVTRALLAQVTQTKRVTRAALVQVHLTVQLPF